MDSDRLFSWLERIAVALETANGNPSLKLGFGETPAPEYVFIRNEGEYFWYFYDSVNDRQIPIRSKALTGLIKELNFTHKEFKGKENVKLDISIAADKAYVLRSGFETFFVKTFLLGLFALGAERIKSSVTIAIQAGNQEGASTVVFCALYVGNERIRYQWNPNADWLRIIAEIQKWLGQSPINDDNKVPHSQPPTAEPVPAGIMQCIEEKMKALGWSTEIGRQVIITRYKKRSRSQMTEAELLDFLQHLERNLEQHLEVEF